MCICIAHSVEYVQSWEEQGGKYYQQQMQNGELCLRDNQACRMYHAIM